MMMEDFRNVPIEGIGQVVGRTITKIRATAPQGGTGTQRLTFLFNDGASLVVDGSFPACSFMVSPVAALRDLDGRRFDGIDCRSLKPRETKGGCCEADLMLTVTADGDEYTLHWTAVGRENFDVSPEPRIHVRASSHPVLA
jgi:hypothetical protein